MNWVYVESKSIYPKDIYGEKVNLNPPGYEIIDFRIPKIGDSYVSSLCGAICGVYNREFTDGPRFIVKKVNSFLKDFDFFCKGHGVTDSVVRCLIEEGFYTFERKLCKKGDIVFTAGGYHVLTLQEDVKAWVLERIK